MSISDLTITEIAQRRRVLGRRADTRLAKALRLPVPLREKLGLRLVRELKARQRQIRHWQDGIFVERTVTLLRAA